MWLARGDGMNPSSETAEPPKRLSLRKARSRVEQQLIVEALMSSNGNRVAGKAAVSNKGARGIAAMKTHESTLKTLRRPGERHVGVGNRSLRRSAPSRVRVVARCANAQEALRAVAIYEPDVLVIDQDMPAIGGVDVLKQLRAAGDQTPVVLLATANNPKLAEALMFNVEGVVFKQSDPKQLIRCLREVHAGRRWLDASVNQYAAATSNSDGQNLDTLTRRQIEVARAAVSGLSNKELAQRLGVSEGTIKNHLHAIYERLQLEGRLALLLYLKEKALA